MQHYNDIDTYIAQFPTDVQEKLEKVRQIIHAAVPEATEKISYGIPTFVYHGNLVHFGGYPKHIGFYPGSWGVEAFKDQLSKYHTSKGTIQFQLDEPIPYDLIQTITQACAEARDKKQ